MRTEMPTAICENEAPEKDRMMIANNSQRSAALFLFIALPLVLIKDRLEKRNANVIVPQSPRFGPITFLLCKHWTFEYVARPTNYLE